MKKIRSTKSDRKAKGIIKILFIFAIILSLLVPVLSLAEKKYGEEEVLSGILKELKGDYLEGDINMGGIILDEFLSKEDIQSIGDEIKLKLEMVEEEEETTYENNFNQLTIYGYDADENPITVMIASYIEPVNSKKETTLFISLIKRGKNFDISGIIEKIKDIFKEFNKPVEITTCIIGTVEGRFKDNIIERSVLKSMKKFKSKVVEKYSDEYMISYTGHTPLIENSIFSGKEKVNLNLAIRYNEIENKTYIWIGTPIITTGY